MLLGGKVSNLTLLLHLGKTNFILHLGHINYPALYRDFVGRYLGHLCLPEAITVDHGINDDIMLLLHSKQEVAVILSLCVIHLQAQQMSISTEKNFNNYMDRMIHFVENSEHLSLVVLVIT